MLARSVEVIILSIYNIFCEKDSLSPSSTKIKIKINLHRECHLKDTAAAKPDLHKIVSTQTIAAEV